MKTNSLLAKVRRLTEQAKPPEQEVDIAAAILKARADHRAGIPRKPATPEQIDNMQRSPLGRAILAARRRLGWN